MTSNDYPEEIQLVRDKKFRISRDNVIEDLETKWCDGLVTLIAGSYTR